MQEFLLVHVLFQRTVIHFVLEVREICSLKGITASFILSIKLWFSIGLSYLLKATLTLGQFVPLHQKRN